MSAFKQCLCGVSFPIEPYDNVCPACGRGRPKRSQVTADGTEFVDSSQFQSFIKKVTYYHCNSGYVCIPAAILKALNCSPEDHVLVAIRKASPQEIRDYTIWKLQRRTPKK